MNNICRLLIFFIKFEIGDSPNAYSKHCDNNLYYLIFYTIKIQT